MYYFYLYTPILITTMTIYSLLHDINEVYNFKLPHSKLIALPMMEAKVYNNNVPMQNIEYFIKTFGKEYVELDGFLIIACWKNRSDIARALLDLGANINALSNYGTTPAMFVAQNDNIELLKHFIQNGALLEVNNKQVIDYARSDAMTRKYLIQYCIENANQKLCDENKSLKDSVNELEDNLAVYKSKVKKLEEQLSVFEKIQKLISTDQTTISEPVPNDESKPISNAEN